MLQINHTYNSYKSIEDGIKKFEKSEDKDRQLSPSSEQTHQENNTEVNQFMKSRVRGKLIRKRTRTESFHYKTNKTSVLEEIKETTHTRNRRKSAKTDIIFSKFKMQVVGDSKNDSDSMSNSSTSSGGLQQETKDKPEKKPNPNVDSPISTVKQLKGTNDKNQLGFKGLSPPNSNKQLKINAGSQAEDYSGFGLGKGGGYKMSVADTDKQEEDKSSPKEDDYFRNFKKKKPSLDSMKPGLVSKKRERRKCSVINVEDEESKEIASSGKLESKIKYKYSIHSIVEEEKSKSSSSTSSLKSSDDLTLYLLNSSSAKRKRSSFWTEPMKSLTTSIAASNSSKSLKSSKSIKHFKTKKYHDGDINLISDSTEKHKSKHILRRRHSISIVLAKFSNSDE
jgi:hypothetical protein